MHRIPIMMIEFVKMKEEELGKTETNFVCLKIRTER